MGFSVDGLFFFCLKIQGLGAILPLIGFLNFDPFSFRNMTIYMTVCLVSLLSF